MKVVWNKIKTFVGDKRLKGIWMLLLFAAGTYFTTYMVQYLLLDSDLFSKLSETKWELNRGCVLVVYLLMLCITNRVGLSAILSHVFFMVLAFVNYYVYMFRENEFIFADIRSIGTGLSVAGNYEIALSERGWQVILASIAFIALSSLFRIKFEKAIFWRALSGLAVVYLCMTISTETKGINTETWEQKGTYQNGYVLNFVLSARDSFVSAPESYTIKQMEELEKHYPKKEKNPLGETLEKEPTIIVVMSESFADLRVVGEMQTNQPLTPFMDSLYENTTKGYALSSVFGAKTPNSEWEFMAGGSMAFLPVGSVVYQQYLNDTPTSMVSTLKEEGYTCVAMHPYYETGWGRNLIYPKLGFDESYFIEHFDQSQLVRKYISDEEMYNKIIERYENRKVNENLFIMSISMQNHGGYAKDYENFEENYYKIGRSYTDANQYFSLIRESDDALRDFVTYFASVDEPVEIVFFGDHQPSLNRNFYKILNGKGLAGLTLKELEALYTVPFFIWTNYDTPEETVEITSLNFLSTMALARAGIDLPPYHQFMADLMEVVPAINARGYYSLERGKYLHVEDALGNELDWITKYENLQYNGLFDNRHRSSIFFPYFDE
ncbi:MAG: LTA synthase family protein [Lachnospiraceae bacterium]|nr:LTA synthase family protein [Lachnospiraceae bacterium]